MSINYATTVSDNAEDNHLGRVIRIISDSRIIVDIGEGDITIGDELLIYSPGEKIYDLNGFDLGNYENIKDTVTVIQTAEHYSVCAKITETIVNPLSSLSALSVSRKERTESSLKINSDDIKPIQSNDDMTVKIGDFVRAA